MTQPRFDKKERAQEYANESAPLPPDCSQRLSERPTNRPENYTYRFSFINSGANGGT